MRAAVILVLTAVAVLSYTAVLNYYSEDKKSVIFPFVSAAHSCSNHEVSYTFCGGALCQCNPSSASTIYIPAIVQQIPLWGQLTFCPANLGCQTVNYANSCVAADLVVSSYSGSKIKCPAEPCITGLDTVETASGSDLDECCTAKRTQICTPPPPPQTEGKRSGSESKSS